MGNRSAWALLAGVLIVPAMPARADHVLQIATEPEDPPFTMRHHGVVGGIATLILQEALERSATPYRIVVLPWLRALETARSEPDSCVYATTPTDERKPLYKWAGPLVRETWVLFARADSAIAPATLAELGNYRIGGSQGAAQTLYLERLGVRVDEINAADNMSYNLKKLQSGRIDLWATGLMRGRHVARQLGGAPIKPVMTLKRVSLYLACNPSVPDDVIAGLNRALAGMETDGTSARLSRAALSADD